MINRTQAERGILIQATKGTAVPWTVTADPDKQAVSFTGRTNRSLLKAVIGLNNLTAIDYCRTVGQEVFKPFLRRGGGFLYPYKLRNIFKSEEKKFDSLEDLKVAIHNDIATAKKLFKLE